MYNLYRWFHALKWAGTGTMALMFCFNEFSDFAYVLSFTLACWAISRAAGAAASWLHFRNYEIRLHSNGRTGGHARRYVRTIQRFR